METSPDNVYGSKKRISSSQAATKPCSKESSKSKAGYCSYLKIRTHCIFSEELSPMLSTLVDDSFDGDDWEYEIK